MSGSMQGSGDLTADFTATFRREYPRLVRALTLSFSPEIAEEAVADGFFAAQRRWRRLEGYDDPVGWIRRVAVNRAIDQHRRAGRRERRELRVGTVGSATPAENVLDLLDLRAAVAAMPERMRLIFSLFYLADLPVTEIAGVLAVSEGTVKRTLYDARQRVRPGPDGDGAADAPDAANTPQRTIAAVSLETAVPAAAGCSTPATRVPAPEPITHTAGGGSETPPTEGPPPARMAPGTTPAPPPALPPLRPARKDDHG
ncbi:MAG: RNA polymerase sigma factor [Acidimicrobiales bacterium]